MNNIIKAKIAGNVSQKRKINMIIIKGPITHLRYIITVTINEGNSINMPRNGLTFLFSKMIFYFSTTKLRKNYNNQLHEAKKTLLLQ
jgi:hypothetical protein